MHAWLGTRVASASPWITGACFALALLSGGSAPHAEGTKRTAPVVPETSPVRPAPTPQPSSSPEQGEAHATAPGYTVKLADVTVPAGVPIGKYRRAFQPFPNWTLICDENLAKKQKVCNIAQTILGPDGSTAFSWSLAAAQDGKPLFILRAPSSIGERGSICLTLPDGGPPILVSIQGCTPAMCLAYQALGQRLRAAIDKAMTIDISYVAGARANTVTFRAPLEGLATALAAI